MEIGKIIIIQHLKYSLKIDKIRQKFRKKIFNLGLTNFKVVLLYFKGVRYD